MEQGTTSGDASLDVKLCECGCGQPAPIAKETNKRLGHVKGQPTRFIQGHGRGAGPRPKYFLEVGQRVGRGVVIEAELRIPVKGKRNHTARAAKLLCDCGTEYVTQIVNLIGKQPRVTSCGCLRRDKFTATRAKAHAAVRGQRAHNFKDRTGQRYGKLVVLQLTKPKPYSSKLLVRWLCQCDCGNEVAVLAAHLASGRIKSCGCLARDLQPISPKSARNQLLKIYMRSARQRNLPWGLSDEDFDRLTSSDCFYCGQPPSSIKAVCYSEYIYNGIDRIDSAKGYLPDNVLPACLRCNFSKRDAPFDDFMAWIGQLVAHNLFHPDRLPSAMIKPALRVVQDGQTA